jgi:hypothetical protein
MGGKGLDSLSADSPRERDAKREMARRAGCSQLGQSAPLALMGCNFWNLWLHVGQRYS